MVMGRRQWALLALALLPLLVLACGETYSGSGYHTAPVATGTPTLGGIAGAYLDAELAAQDREHAEALATASAANHHLTVQAAQSVEDNAQAALQAATEATHQAIDHAGTMQVLDFNATAQMVAFDGTATAQARYETATAQSEVDNATATAQARYLTATTNAQRSTATARADWLTATAAAHQENQTATADAYYWQQTVAADRVTSTSVAVTATSEARAAERERLTQPLRTFGPWVVGALGIVGGGYIVWRFAVVAEIQGRQIRRDERGDAPIYAAGDAAAITLHDPDRSFWGTTTIIDGEVTVHETAPTPQHQARLVAGDQALDMLTRGSLNTEGCPSGFTRRQRASVAQRLVGPGRSQQGRGRGAIAGLRSVQVIEDLSQATRAGMIPPMLAAHAERDWIEGEWVDV
jgi:hypothetical protein